MDINKTYELPFPVSQVYSAWISNDFAVAPVTSIEIEPKVGGVFRLTTVSGQNIGKMEGKILQIDHNRCIRYTWHWGGPDTPSVVDARFSENDGRTFINLSHSGLESAESVKGHESGWDRYIDGLTQQLHDRSDNQE